MRSFVLLDITAAAGTGFHGIMPGGPIRYPAGVDEKFGSGHIALVAQHERCVLTITALAAIAVNDDLLRGLAGGQRRHQVLLVMEIVELIGPGYMALLVGMVIAGINKKNKPLLCAR